MTITVRPLVQRIPETWTRALRVGAIGALGLVFICLSGMPVRLDVREVVVPVLSLGYLVLLVAPLVVGVLLFRRPEHEAFLDDPSSDGELLLGATAGGLVAVADCRCSRFS